MQKFIETNTEVPKEFIKRFLIDPKVIHEESFNKNSLCIDLNDIGNWLDMKNNDLEVHMKDLDKEMHYGIRNTDKERKIIVSFEGFRKIVSKLEYQDADKTFDYLDIIKEYAEIYKSKIKDRKIIDKLTEQNEGLINILLNFKRVNRNMEYAEPYDEFSEYIGTNTDIKEMSEIKLERFLYDQFTEHDITILDLKDEIECMSSCKLPKKYFENHLVANCHRGPHEKVMKFRKYIFLKQYIDMCKSKSQNIEIQCINCKLPMLSGDFKSHLKKEPNCAKKYTENTLRVFELSLIVPTQLQNFIESNTEVPQQFIKKFLIDSKVIDGENFNRNFQYINLNEVADWFDMEINDLDKKFRYTETNKEKKISFEDFRKISFKIQTREGEQTSKYLDLIKEKAQIYISRAVDMKIIKDLEKRNDELGEEIKYLGKENLRTDHYDEYFDERSVHNFNIRQMAKMTLMNFLRRELSLTGIFILNEHGDFECHGCNLKIHRICVRDHLSRNNFCQELYYEDFKLRKYELLERYVDIIRNETQNREIQCLVCKAPLQSSEFQTHLERASGCAEKYSEDVQEIFNSL